MSDEKIVLKPCPRCKSENCTTSKWTNRQIAVYCKDCAYTGWLAWLKEGAIKAWNDEEERAGR